MKNILLFILLMPFFVQAKGLVPGTIHFNSDRVETCLIKLPIKNTKYRVYYKLSEDGKMLIAPIKAIDKIVIKWKDENIVFQSGHYSYMAGKRLKTDFKNAILINYMAECKDLSLNHYFHEFDFNKKKDGFVFSQEVSLGNQAFLFVLKWKNENRVYAYPGLDNKQGVKVRGWYLEQVFASKVESLDPFLKIDKLYPKRVFNAYCELE